MKTVRSLLDQSVFDMLMSGQPIIIPTDTVYGIVARAADKTAVTKLYGLKDRSRQPGTMIAANIDQLHKLGFSYSALHKADAYWPDALSVILDAKAVPSYLKTTLPDLAVRIPNHPELLQLLHITGPLMTTSANPHACTTATTVGMAKDYFKNAIPLYVDGGDLSGRPPSTIIRIDEDKITVLRLGAVTI